MLLTSESWVIERKFWPSGWRPYLFAASRAEARAAASRERRCGHTVRVAIWQRLQRWA